MYQTNNTRLALAESLCLRAAVTIVRKNHRQHEEQRDHSVVEKLTVEIDAHVTHVQALPTEQQSLRLREDVENWIYAQDNYPKVFGTRDHSTI